MIIGVPREVKPDEYRVGMVPVGVEELTRAGHQVLIEQGAGLGAGIADEDYVRYGACLVDQAEEVWGRAALVVKVKEPQARELQMVRPGQVVFTFFHFAADLALTEGMIRSGAVAIAYETVRDARGRLPLLTPMSEVAGRMSIQQGAKCLERPMQGRGVLLGGVPGVEPATVLILGGGVVGTNAAKVAAGLGARVIIMDVDGHQMR
ncbi:MAG TPA: alanine dehydrogenase, partial [Phycisphaerae bacterium]|nr:alanine dehydrogenase [Phycisphaerae bacterium]